MKEIWKSRFSKNQIKRYLFLHFEINWESKLKDRFKVLKNDEKISEKELHSICLKPHFHPRLHKLASKVLPIYRKDTEFFQGYWMQVECLERIFLENVFGSLLNVFILRENVFFCLLCSSFLKNIFVTGVITEWFFKEFDWDNLLKLVGCFGSCFDVLYVLAWLLYKKTYFGSSPDI